MGYTDKINKKPTTSVSVETLMKEADIAQHEETGNTARSGISWESISRLNDAERDLFVAAIASIVPGIDPQLHKARQALDHAFEKSFIAWADKTVHSTKVLKQITAAFDKHGLNTSQLDIT